VSDPQDRAFDVAAYVRSPIELRPTDLDVSATAGLRAGVLAVVEHLWTVERAILDLLRDLLLTPTHTESRVTAFLNTWAYEQYWLTQTLRAVLEANGDIDPDRPANRIGAVRRAWDERVRPTISAVRSNLVGEDIVAAQVTLGWLDTAVIHLGYQRLGELEPRLAELAAKVEPLKARHLAFYWTEARSRLDASVGGRRLARRAIARWRWPEVRYAGRTAVRPVVEMLYADRATASRLRAIDADVARLPGLADLTPVRRALGGFATS